MAHAAERGLVWIRHWRRAVNGVVRQCRNVGSVHSLLVLRIKSLRTLNKSDLWPGVNGWLGLAQSGALREWVQGVLCRCRFSLEFSICQVRRSLDGDVALWEKTKGRSGAYRRAPRNDEGGSET